MQDAPPRLPLPARASEPRARDAAPRAPQGAGAIGALALAAVTLTGCFTWSSADVRVRDPARASLVARDNAPLVAPGEAGDAVVARGTTRVLFESQPYEVRARRASDGSISLHCEACEDVGFPVGAGQSRVTLLGEGGLSRPASTWDLVVHDTGVTVDYDVCMMTLGRHGHCAVPTRTRLWVPVADVVEVHRRVEPVRAWGYLLLVVSALGLAATNYGIFASHDASERAAIAFVGLPPMLFLGGIGLWEAVAPVKDETWRPGP